MVNKNSTGLHLFSVGLAAVYYFVNGYLFYLFSFVRNNCSIPFKRNLASLNSDGQFCRKS